MLKWIDVKAALSKMRCKKFRNTIIFGQSKSEYIFQGDCLLHSPFFIYRHFPRLIVKWVFNLKSIRDAKYLQRKRLKSHFKVQRTDRTKAISVRCTLKSVFCIFYYKYYAALLLFSLCFTPIYINVFFQNCCGKCRLY